MELAFFARAAAACAVIALVLAALRYALNVVARQRIGGGTRPKLVSVVETTMLSQGTSLHVVRVGARYVLLGCCAANVALLADVPSPQVAPVSARDAS